MGGPKKLIELDVMVMESTLITGKQAVVLLSDGSILIIPRFPGARFESWMGGLPSSVILFVVSLWSSESRENLFQASTGGSKLSFGGWGVLVRKFAEKERAWIQPPADTSGGVCKMSGYFWPGYIHPHNYICPVVARNMETAFKYASLHVRT